MWLSYWVSNICTLINVIPMVVCQPGMVRSQQAAGMKQSKHCAPAVAAATDSAHVHLLY